MDHYKETATTWNKLANLYEEKFMELTLYNETYDFICDSLAENQIQVLELGCGPGMISRYLLSKRPDLKILGTDVSENMVSLARKNNPDAKFLQLDCREISSLNLKFDAILIGFCIPYLNNADVGKLITDSFEMLHQNGLIYISFVDGDDTLSGLKTGSSGHRMYFYYHQTEGIAEKLVETSFTKTRIFEVEYPLTENQIEIHTIICAVKNGL